MIFKAKEWHDNYWGSECGSRVEDQGLSLGHSIVRRGLGEREGLTKKTENTHPVGGVGKAIVMKTV